MPSSPILRADIVDTFFEELGREVIAQLVDPSLGLMAGYLNNVTDRFSSGESFTQGDTFSVNIAPKLTKNNVVDRVENSNVEFQKATIGKRSISLDFRKVLPLEIGAEAQDLSIHDLVELYRESAVTAVQERIETDAFETLTNDSEIDASHRYEPANGKYDAAFYRNLNTRFFQAKIGDNVRKIHVVDAEGYEDVLADELLTKQDAIGPNNEITRGIVLLPKYGIEVRRSNNVVQETSNGSGNGRYKSLAFTETSFLYANRPQAEYTGKISRQVNDPSGKFSILFTLDSDPSRGITTQMYMDLLYGFKVEQPESVFVITR